MREGQEYLLGYHKTNKTPSRIRAQMHSKRILLLHFVCSLAEETLGCMRQQDRALIDNVGTAINGI